MSGRWDHACQGVMIYWHLTELNIQDMLYGFELNHFNQTLTLVQISTTNYNPKSSETSEQLLHVVAKTSTQWTMSRDLSTLASVYTVSKCPSHHFKQFVAKETKMMMTRFVDQSSSASLMQLMQYCTGSKMMPSVQNFAINVNFHSEHAPLHCLCLNIFPLMVCLSFLLNQPFVHLESLLPWSEH